MTTTEIAFRLSVNSLTEHQPGTSKVFFWTFTSPEVLEKEEFSRRWNNFVRALKRLYPKMPWIRVFELHPGLDEDFNGHGMHAHAIFPSFKRWEVLDHLARKVGLGRVHVKALPLAKARNYLAKYLSKTKRADAPAILRSVRLWATINFPTKTRCKDILRWTFQSWFHRRVSKKGNWPHMIKLVAESDPKLAWKLRIAIGVLPGYKRFLRLSEFFVENVYALSEILQNFYNFDASLSLGSNFQPMKVF